MSRSQKPTPPTRPYRSVASQMTFDHHVAVEEAAAAELRGDWVTAFERHRSIPMFAESPHGAMLQVLVTLGGEAPRWLVNRFLTVMAHRLESYGQPRRSGRVLQHVVPKLYPESIPWEVMDCDHPQQVGPQIFGRDWVVRQVDVFDLGGLGELIGTGDAYGASLQGAYAMDWALAPMGGYRVVAADGEVMTVADALSGETFELLDLGLTAQHPVGTHVLGRVVPIDEDPELAFDWQPLPIDARIAREVASRPDEWLDVVAARTASGALPAGFSHLPPASLSSDLPRHSWTSLLGHPIGAELPRPPATMAAEALKRALRRAADDPDDLRRDRHVVTELLLDELVDDRMVARFATATYADGWGALAYVARPEARGRCEAALWMIDAGSGDLAG